MSDTPDIIRIQQQWNNESVTLTIVQLDGGNMKYIFSDALNGNVTGSYQTIEQCRESSTSLRDFLERCENAGLTVVAREI